MYATARRRETVEDDQWDRVVSIEHSVRRLHLETAKHLRALDEAIDGVSLRLPAKVARLNRALDDERTLVWLRAHVHAEIALTRWDFLYLLRQVELHPGEMENLVTAIRNGIDERHQALAALSQRVARYLTVGGAVSGVIDRIRLVRRSKLAALLRELEEFQAVFPPELMSADQRRRDPIPLPGGTPQRRARDRLIGGVKALPELTAPALKVLEDRLPRVLDRRRPEPPIQNDGEPHQE